MLCGILVICSLCRPRTGEFGTSMENVRLVEHLAVLYVQLRLVLLILSGYPLRGGFCV
jgi:hypothetical protein